jgi:hypothetical protein
MKNEKENKIRLVLVFMIFFVILIAFIYLKQNKNILREEEKHHTETVTQLERITMSENDMKESDTENMTTAPHDISNWEMQSPVNTEPDTGETIFVQ